MAVSGEEEPDYAAALEAVNAFIEIARKHVDDDSLAIALVSTGAALMAECRAARDCSHVALAANPTHAARG